MSDSPNDHSLASLLVLRDVRRYLRRSHGVGLAVLIAVAYALASMSLGGMLVLGRYSGGYNVLVLWGNALGLQSWNYPGLLIEAPWGFIELPFFATFSMIVVSAGVGLGMAVAILLGIQLVRDRKGRAGRTAATAGIAGLTPAMIALVTLGACCSVTAVATGGVGLVAEASGSSSTNLLLNNWYLGVFQIVVVYVALIAQELVLRVSGDLLGVGSSQPSAPKALPASLDGRSLAAAALRIALLAGGLTWCLAVLADWTTVHAASAPAGLWFNWLIEHWLIGGFAVASALGPRTIHGWVRRAGATASGLSLRAVLFVAACTLGLWVPPPLAGAGVEGFGNELLGLFGVPATFGGVGPVFPWGVALALRWSFQYVLLAAFAGTSALTPARSLSWLSETKRLGRERSISASASPASGPISTNAR